MFFWNLVTLSTSPWSPAGFLWRRPLGRSSISSASAFSPGPIEWSDFLIKYQIWSFKDLLVIRKLVHRMMDSKRKMVNGQIFEKQLILGHTFTSFDVLIIGDSIPERISSVLRLFELNRKQRQPLVPRKPRRRGVFLIETEWPVFAQITFSFAH